MAHVQQPNAQNVSRAIRNIADGYQDLVIEAALIPNISARGSDRSVASTVVTRATAASKPGHSDPKPDQRALECNPDPLRLQAGRLDGEATRRPLMRPTTLADDAVQRLYELEFPLITYQQLVVSLQISRATPQLQVAAGVLGLPALASNPLVDQRRRQIAEYLGIPY
ncbi:hypothetical protein BDD12DRAFT_908355 [Trichophaea hybrida]|nr:hypothetical protein BDD12DRAFT_908355 [Trichophaea hybrida]